MRIRYFAMLHLPLCVEPGRVSAYFYDEYQASQIDSGRTNNLDRRARIGALTRPQQLAANEHLDRPGRQDTVRTHRRSTIVMNASSTNGRALLSRFSCAPCPAAGGAEVRPAAADRVRGADGRGLAAQPRPGRTERWHPTRMTPKKHKVDRRIALFPPRRSRSGPRDPETARVARRRPIGEEAADQRRPRTTARLRG